MQFQSNTRFRPARRTGIRNGIRAAAFACAVLALLCWLARPAWAQSASGTISGTVTDTTGAVIPHATVVLKNLATNVTTTTTSNGAGLFVFAAVPPSTYDLTVSAKGFTTWVGTDIVVHLGENHTVPRIMLPVASASTKVQVTASEAGVIHLDRIAWPNFVSAYRRATPVDGCDSSGFSACLSSCASVMPSCEQQCKSYAPGSYNYNSCSVECSQSLGSCQRSCESEYPGCGTICTYPYGPGDGCGS